MFNLALITEVEGYIDHRRSTIQIPVIFVWKVQEWSVKLEKWQWVCLSLST